MQTAEQIWTNEGKKCSGTIVSPYWIATSESCCENSKLATITLSDWRVETTGSQSTGSTSTHMCGNCGPYAGRKRRSTDTTTETTNPMYGENCIDTNACINHGICLIRTSKYLNSLSILMN